MSRQTSSLDSSPISSLLMFFSISELVPKIVPLGCFIDKKWNRLLRNKFAKFESPFSSWDPFATVIKCTHLARDMDYEYFAVQNFGDCYTGKNITENFDRYGEAPADKCVGGVSAAYTNFVYRLRPAIDGPNVCETLPCKNKRTCVVHFHNPQRYYCECGDWFTGDNCESKYSWCLFASCVQWIFLPSVLAWII